MLTRAKPLTAISEGIQVLSVAAFDTHAFVKRLTAVGMPEAQAEVLADEQARLIDQRLATTDDLSELARKADIFEVRADILKWMFGTMGFQVVVLLGALVALAKAFR